MIKNMIKLCIGTICKQQTLEMTRKVRYFEMTAKQLITKLPNLTSGNETSQIRLSKFQPFILQLKPTDKQVFLKYLMMGIYKKKILINGPTDEQDNERIMQNILQQFPQLKLEWKIWKINNLYESKTENYIQIINDTYLQCFKNVIPKLQKDKKIRGQAILYKNFGKYLTMTNGDLNKAEQFLSKSIDNFTQLVGLQSKKIDSKEYLLEKQDHPEQYKIKVNATKENIRKLVEAAAQCGYLIFSQISHSKSHISTFQNISEAKINQLQQVMFKLQQCQRLYSIIPGIKPLSQYYHKIRKIIIQIQTLISSNSKYQGEFKYVNKFSAKKQFQILIKECEEHLHEAIAFPQIARQITIAMITAKYHILRSQMPDKLSPNQEEDLYKNLMNSSSDIIQRIPLTYRRSLIKIIGDIVKSLSVKTNK